MHMKEDHILNSQLKPGYNVQNSINIKSLPIYSIHQNPTDTKTLKPHLESFEEKYNLLPKEITADTGIQFKRKL